ncbi:MAG: S-layer homology domain-containing protein [Clostridia bacterium]|nr:S-layer homology domain-containing protein [Clostridia bacterium]
MFRKNFVFLVIGVFAVMLVALPVSASVLSPGLNLLSDRCDMVKAGIVRTDISFSQNDFTNSLGYLPDSITVTSLPSAAQGTLYFGGKPAAVNQEISSVNLGLLRFVPASSCTTASFRFKGDGDYSHNCTIRFTQSVNASPITALQTSTMQNPSVWTQQDISTYGTLSASDPDGDALHFEIVSYPEKGLLTVTNTAVGDFIYTPYMEAEGEDVFSYRVRDDYGNYSEVQTVSVAIDKAACDIEFADMDGHWALNAAVVMVAENAMPVYAENGNIYFSPEEEISRADFLVTVMKALGAGEIAPCQTIFNDHDEIPVEATGYVDRAYTLGIIRGSEDTVGVNFRPGDTITRAEAAVILNAIIGAQTPEIQPVFADNSTIPVWAGPSLYALNDLGIMRGTGSGNISPDATLNRAQTAQILLTIKQLLADS